jgi:antibiotic biosynthesis monooxygenase (ABM) superfamily enzyme
LATIVVGPFQPTSFERWREFHFKHLEAIRRAGIVSDRICRPAGDSSSLVVIQEVEDLDSFMAWMASPESEEIRSDSPIEGEFNVLILEEIERPF